MIEIYQQAYMNRSVVAPIVCRGLCLVVCGGLVKCFVTFVLSRSHWYPGLGVVFDCVDS